MPSQGAAWTQGHWRLLWQSAYSYAAAQLSYRLAWLRPQLRQQPALLPCWCQQVPLCCPVWGGSPLEPGLLQRQWTKCSAWAGGLVTQGLGAQGQGMATPLVPVQLPGRQCVGYSTLSAAGNNAAHLTAVQAAQQVGSLRRHQHQPRKRAWDKLQLQRHEQAMLGQAASLSLLMAETTEAPAAEPEHAAQAEGDIWLDQATMEYLKLQEHGPDTIAAERRRVERRARQYVTGKKSPRFAAL
jgi:hypothetical protein